MTKKWIIQELPPQSFFEEHPELPRLLVQLLWNRGLKTQQQIDEFLNPDYSLNIHDPFLFNDMEKAVQMIFDCIKENKKITVHGDYDADGVDAAVIIISTLKKLGAKNVDVFIPHREIDGYGLNDRTVRYLKDNGTHLIITCDCGISNVGEIKLARELGMQVIITDHHAMPPKLPEADAILHPLVPGEKYPDRTLSGGGVAFKLIQALLRQHRSNVGAKGLLPLPGGETHEAFEKWLLDCAAISTVADMVPLVGESRTIVRYGLTVLNKTRNLGLKHLLIKAGLMDEDGKAKRLFTTQTISFQIAPRINAAGRMDHANVAFALLMAETEEEAEKLAEQLNQNNVDRQKLTDKLVTEARKQIAETKQEKNPIIFVLGEGWSTGILGLIASRIKEEFYKPAFVMGFNKEKKEITGSGRSIVGFNMIETMKTAPHLFHKFGGHPQACGFSLATTELLEEFKKTMLEKATVATKDIDLTPQIKIDSEVDLDEVNWKLYDLLQKFEPFGVANEEPVYAATGVTVMGIEPVGADGKHLRLMVKHKSHVVRKTIAFGFGDTARHPADWKINLKPGDMIDLAFNVSVNEWNGNRELQLQVVDMKKSS